MKVRIKNFQSIENCSFEIPEKAFTCIVGPSNIGKSAIRRALNCLLYNYSDAGYIRNGEKECSVEVEFDIGTKVLWYRTELTSGYNINGVPYTKLSKSVPEPILDMGFKELVLSKEKINVQVASQFSNLFLLDPAITGSKITEVFSNLGNLNRIISANKACSSDLKNNKSKVTIRKDDLVLIKEKVKSFSGLDEQRHLLAILKDAFFDIKKQKEIIDNLKDLLIKLNKSVNIVKILKPVLSINLQVFDIDINILTNLKNVIKKYQDSEIKNKEFSLLKNIKEISFSLEKENELFFNLLEKFKNYQKITDKLILYKNLKEEISYFEDTDLSKIIKIKDIYNKILKCKNEIISCREDISKSEDNIKVLEKEEIEIKKILKVCPLCNKEFKQEDTCLK